jgi:FtsZ-interacting cell division protein YlmF
MSALNKMMGFLGLVDTDEENAIAEAPSRPVAARPQRERTGVTVLGSHSPAQAASQPAMIEEPVSHYNIITLQPRSYSEARKVGEYYREGNPVIINLDDMEESERKRLVDFASGLVFGLHGRIERISLKVFLLSPANVNVSNEDKTAAQASFFNQS